MKTVRICILMTVILFNLATQAQDMQPQLDALTVPDGFEISIFAQNTHAPRSLALGTQGTVFAGTRSPTSRNVYAYVDSDKDGLAETHYLVDSELDAPNAVLFKDGALYVVDTQFVYRYDDIENHLANPPEPVIVYEGLPSNPQHGWRYAAFAPDGRLYIAVGAPCNICEYDPDVYGLILSMTDTGEDLRIEARGIRNSVGFDWNPLTGELWFTENGRDWLSDDLPPDELNRISAPNLNFGFPYCHGDNLEDTDFPRENACEGTEAPMFAFPAHVAPLGMRFYTGAIFPEAYHHQLFVAEHGSRNRTVPVGYEVSLIRFDENGEVLSYEPFITGFLQGEHDYEAWGRPVDLLVMPDGSLLISDDQADAIYRVRYVGN